jgi:hypothetical protein
MAKNHKVRVTFECSAEFKREIFRSAKDADLDMSKFIRQRIRDGRNVPCQRCGRLPGEQVPSLLLGQAH